MAFDNFRTTSVKTYIFDFYISEKWETKRVTWNIQSYAPKLAKKKQT